MRSLSVGVILYALLITAVIFCGPLSNLAVAQPGVVLGFVVGDNDLVESSELGREFSQYLEEQLALPVRVRSFAAETQLYAWLTRYSEVDIAWLTRDFLQKVPAGQIYPLTRNLDHSSGRLQGEIVSRQGLSSDLRQQVREVLMSMNNTSAGRKLLAQFGVSRFVAAPLWQTSGWEISEEQSTPDESGKQDEVGWQTTGWKSGEKAATIKPVSEVKQASSAAAVAVEPEPSGQIRAADGSLPPIAGAAPAVSEEQPTSVPLLTEQKAEVPEEIFAAVQEKTPVVTTEGAAADTSGPPRSLMPDSITGPSAERAPEEPVAAMTEKPAPVAEPADEKQIALVADYLSYNAEEDSYEAKGEVVLRRAGVELKSDELLWQSATQDVAAVGGVHLEDAGAKVSGERLQYNMSTGQGQVREGRVFIQEDNFHLAGAEIEKQGHADYFVKNGSFTTCDGEIPDWKFSAEEVDVSLGGYAKAKNVFFHIKDVPVLYTPYLFFPVKTERESGLLSPWFGYSNNKGVRASMAWYQVIDRHMDATIYLDYLSEIALGKGLEYRYSLANQNEGEALYYHVTGFDDVPDMYYLEWKHRGRLPGGWRLTSDVEYADEQQLFDEFGEIAEDYNRDKTVSTIILQKNWEKLNLVAHGRYIKDLEDDNDSTLQRLPELSLSLARYRLADSPFYLGLESYATRFWRQDGEDGERVYLAPSLSAVFKPGSWLEFSPEVILHERLYDTDAGDNDQFVPEYNLSLATRFIKSFNFNHWGVDRLQHSIEPKITYSYIPDETQEDLPLFDLSDRIGPRNAVSYALINRLIARSSDSAGVKSYRDFLNLRLSQSYDIDEARNNTSGLDQPFSDVRLELDFWPTRNISLDVESLIPVYGATQFRTLKVGASARDDEGNAVKVDYNYKDEAFADVATDYIKLQLDTPILKPVYLRLEERYDFREGRELERVAGLEYRSKCWSLLLTYRSRFEENGDDDHEIMINFVLAGLSQNKGFGNGFDSTRNR